jgi:hypothetical protein
MSDQATVEETGNTETNSGTPSVPKDVLDAAVAEALKPIKDKLDAAYAKIDELKTQNKAHQDKIREMELTALREKGQLEEALKMERDSEKEKRIQAEERAHKLERDSEVKSLLATVEFRNEKAFKMALREITDELVADGENVWKHKSGKDMKEFVTSYLEDDSNSYLIKPKVSTGAGSSTITNKASPKSLFQMSQDEVLKLAGSGQLRKK